MKKEKENDYGNCAECNKELTQMGALLWDNSGVLCNDCDMTQMVIPNLKRKERQERLAEDNANIERVDAQTRGVK